MLTALLLRSSRHLLFRCHAWPAHPFLLGFSIALAMFGLLGGRPRLWELSGPTALFGSTTALVIIGLAGMIAALFPKYIPLPYGKIRTEKTTDQQLNGTHILPRLAAGASLALVGIFLSDWLSRPYSLFTGPFVRPEASIVGGCVWYLVYQKRRAQKTALLFLPVIGSLIAFTSFLNYGDGRTLVSDDHTVFLYRLQLLKEQFPSIPFYYPLWNGGTDARDFFASGSLNLFLLMYPIIASFEVWHVYTTIIALSLFVIPPASLAIATRLLGLSRASAACAATLALAPSLLWYRWGLAYGTMGFITSASLAPLCWALWYRISELRVPVSRPLWLATFAITTLVAFWSLAPLAIAPVALTLLPFRFRELYRRRVLSLIAALVVFNLPWIVLFLTVSRVTSFLGADAEASRPTSVVTSPVSLPSPTSATVDSEPTSHSRMTFQQHQTAPAFRHRSSGLSVSRAVAGLRSWGVTLHPLLFILGPIGVLVFRRRLGLLFGAQLGWLLVIGTVLVPLKPQLELDRMLVMASVFLCIPTGVALRVLMRLRTARLSSERDEHRMGRWRASLAPITSVGALLSFAFLILTPLYTSSIAQNRSREEIYFSSSAYDSIVQTVKEHGGPGRVLFSGQVLHELDNGHVAPLTILTRHPMVASSPVHNLWSYQQVIPRDFLARGETGIEDYLTKMNVSLVFAHDPKWRQWFSSRPERYTQVLSGPPFAAFRRIQVRASYFIEGDGTIVSQDTDGFTFKPTTADGVVSFRWFPFLRPDGGCDLAPHPVGQDLTFIRFSRCTPGQSITVRAGSPLDRLLTQGG